MPQSTKNKIVVIGCGNVAWHLSKKLSANKSNLIFVYNHRANEALNAFSSTLKCITAPSLNTIEPDADLYFICVADKHIAQVSKKIKCKNPAAVVMHTSGSMRLSEIKSSCKNKGVFYPLQSFSKNDDITWKEVPVIIDSANDVTEKKMLVVAKSFTPTVLSLTYKDRLRLHLAAVLVNNFTNALYVAADDLLQQVHVKQGFGILMPLIQKTTGKLTTLRPRAAQTGPAKRRDTPVLKKHADLLAHDKQLKKIYKQLSKLILTQQQAYAKF